MMKINRAKLAKFVAIFFAIFLIGGIGGVFFDQKVLPFIRSNRLLSKIDFLQRTAENVTVIKTTEQVTVKEGDSINEISSQASNATVNILSLSTQKDPITRTNKSDSKSGTGVIVTSDGMIVTYRGAIIEKNATYKILFYNGSYQDVTLVGIDPNTDLAYLKVNVSNLTAISFGDSASVAPGKKLVAIGNTFGEYQNRYASGILSNVNKTFNLDGMALASTEKHEGALEVDFSNQSAYIGGPIINYNGDLIGILGKLVIDGKEYFFGIPSNIVQKSLSLAVDGKFDERPYVGAYYISITKEYAIAHDLKTDSGALIYSPSGKQGLAIISGSPAEKAGLRINDIVTMVNDQTIDINHPLSNVINQFKKGDSVELTIERESGSSKILLKL